jgi:transaldolase/glucose-6-phosphate isomerase
MAPPERGVPWTKRRRRTPTRPHLPCNDPFTPADYPAEITMTDHVSISFVARLRLGEGGPAYDLAVGRARDEEWATRLFDRDVTLWTTDERVGNAIAERLGWLDAPGEFADRTAALEGFGDAVVDEGFTNVVVAGMGGSSLAPDVLDRTFGSQEGYPELRILDSTDPEYVTATLDDLDPLRTLVLVASKSGTTTEPNAFLAAAWERARVALDAVGHHVYENPGGFIAAITDPGRSVEAIAHHDQFREVFLNPPDIGGRYSALTYVGLVPASLIGLDLDALLASANAMLGACREPDPASNPGVSLGLAIGTLAKAGRDKLTFLTDDAISSFGAWVEQLIAESTGKRGTGIVPVDLEPPGAVASYGPDRAFVRITLAGSADPARDDLATALEEAGHPVIRIDVADPIDLGAEFVRWEVATAIAGAVLGIDPFDQPNVEEAKQLTRDVLERHGRGENDTTPPPAPIATGDGLALHGDAALRLTSANGSVTGELARHLARRRPTAYLALQAFIAPTPARDAALARIRAMLRDRTGRATTSGYGPRFLHSTGQLHKGGAPIGWFLQLTANHPVDREIPGWPYTFGELIDAQASGDFAAIESHDLPILRVHLGDDPDAGLEALERAIEAALDTPTEA